MINFSYEGTCSASTRRFRGNWWDSSQENVSRVFFLIGQHPLWTSENTPRCRGLGIYLLQYLWEKGAQERNRNCSFSSGQSEKKISLGHIKLMNENEFSIQSVEFPSTVSVKHLPRVRLVKILNRILPAQILLNSFEFKLNLILSLSTVIMHTKHDCRTYLELLSFYNELSVTKQFRRS